MASSSDDVGRKPLLKLLQSQARQRAREEHEQAKRNEETNPASRSRTEANTNRRAVESSERTRLKRRIYTELLEENVHKITVENKKAEKNINEMNAIIKDLLSRINHLENPSTVDTQSSLNGTSQSSTHTMESDNENDVSNEIGIIINQDEDKTAMNVSIDQPFYLSNALHPSTTATQLSDEQLGINETHNPINQHVDIIEGEDLNIASHPSTPTIQEEGDEMFLGISNSFWGSIEQESDNKIAVGSSHCEPARGADTAIYTEVHRAGSNARKMTKKEKKIDEYKSAA